MEIKWSRAERKKTSVGYVWVRYWRIPPVMAEGFWIFWNNRKAGLKKRGYSVYKNGGDWYFSQSCNAPPNGEFAAEDSQIVAPPREPLVHVGGLREWQVPHTSALVASVRKWGAAIDGSDAGVGKTFSSCAVARELGLRIGVICPLAVIESWNRIVAGHFKMGDKKQFILNYESVRTGKYKEIAVWKKKDGAKYKKEFIWTCPKDTLLIFDECHKCKGNGTKTSAMLIAAKAQGYKILLCSATTAIDPTELRAIGYALGIHPNKYFNDWLEQNGCLKGRLGYQFNQNKDILQKLNKQLFLERGDRLKRDDIKGFPVCDIIVDSYNLGESTESNINSLYSEMKKEIQELESRTGMNDKEKALCKLTEILRARQKIELLKVPLFVEMVEDALHDGFSVVLMVNFSDTINALSEKLNTKTILWGNNKPNERTKFIDSFQSDQDRVIIVNIASGGVGLSLHDLNGKYPRLSIISPNYSAVLLKQALGRVWRDGAKTKAVQKIVYAANTVEDDMCSKLKIKINNMDTINDGDMNPNGIEF